MISWLNWPSMFHLNTQNLQVKTCFKFWVLMFPSCVLGSPNRIPRCDRHCPICLWLPRSRLSRGLHIHVRQYILTISRVGTTKLLVNTSYVMNNNWQGDPILMVLHQHCFRPAGEYPLLHSHGLLGRLRQYSCRWALLRKVRIEAMEQL